MKQKTGRKLLSFLLTLAMVVGLIPGMSLTANAAEASQEEENAYVWYGVGYYDYGFNVKGRTDSDYIQTTYNDYGYATVMQVGEGEEKTFDSFAYGKEYTLDDVTAYITARIKGKDVYIDYTVTNNSAENRSVKIGSYADV